MSLLLFFFNDTATTEIYTLSLHDALPISLRADAAAAELELERGDDRGQVGVAAALAVAVERPLHHRGAGQDGGEDRKSTRLNSSHANISYAVFCLKKKKYLCFSSPITSSS